MKGKNMLFKITGVLICITAILGGIAIWLFMLISGIVGLAETLSVSPIDGSDVGWNIVKILFAELAGGLFAFVVFVWGLFLISLGGNR